jgi:hypothetical protein
MGPMEIFQESLRICAQVRSDAENVRVADEVAREARAELGRSIQAGKDFGLSVGVLAEVAGVARVTGYRLMSTARNDARDAGRTPSRTVAAGPRRAG